MMAKLEAFNFENSEALNKFIERESEAFENGDKKILYSDFNDTELKKNFTCTITLNLLGKDIVNTHSKKDNYTILRIVDKVKRVKRK
ncbi:MAG: hypothetical protein Q7W45_02360 [Bacteroidota bacterium]|nr:hypothetical protein [Bacteroidota bacterium]MDP3145905.1 hypothetical protein [Bacteroidota bacterium]MDP3558539.1 hypothetical protein [Bacteroidota bacterium]